MVFGANHRDKTFGQIKVFDSAFGFIVMEKGDAFFGVKERGDGVAFFHVGEHLGQLGPVGFNLILGNFGNMLHFFDAAVSKIIIINLNVIFNVKRKQRIHRPFLGIRPQRRIIDFNKQFAEFPLPVRRLCLDDRINGVWFGIVGKRRCRGK